MLLSSYLQYEAIETKHQAKQQIVQRNKPDFTDLKI